MSIQDEYQNVCYNIRWLRKHHGLSRTAMARKLHITVKTLDSIEDGVIPQRIRIDFLFQAEQAFGVPPKQLLRVRLADTPMKP